MKKIIRNLIYCKIIMKILNQKIKINNNNQIIWNKLAKNIKKKYRKIIKIMKNKNKK